MKKVLALIALCLVVAGQAPAVRAEKAQPVPATYLALGDSYAFGYTTEAEAEPSPGYQGYVALYAERLETKKRPLNVINLAIPGETSATFFTGGSPGAYLNQNYPLTPTPAGYPTNAIPQMDLALTRIEQEHQAGRAVTRITLQIGGNDLLALVTNPEFGTVDEARRQQALAYVLDRVAARYAEILRRLRAAAPEALLLTVGYLNPFPPLGPSFPFQDFARQAVPALNRVIAARSRAAGAIYVDLYDRFLGHEGQWTNITGAPTPGPTPGTQAPNVHPNDKGYKVIAHLLLAADPE